MDSIYYNSRTGGLYFYSEKGVMPLSGLYFNLNAEIIEFETTNPIFRKIQISEDTIWFWVLREGDKGENEVALSDLLRIHQDNKFDIVAYKKLR